MHHILTFMRQFASVHDVYAHGALLRLAQSGGIHMGCDMHEVDGPRLQRLEDAGFLKFVRIKNYYGPRNDPSQCYDAFRITPTDMTLDAIRAYQTSDIDLLWMSPAVLNESDPEFGRF
jgi:hypothetical protein